MAAIRRASAVWEGDLMNGRGTVSAGSSNLFTELPVTWASRTEEEPGGKTSPEELLAAAHACCFAMALSHGLATSGTPAERLRVSAAVTFDRMEGGFRVMSSALSVRGRVPGLDVAGFQKAAETARDGCPVSQALKNNVRLSLDAALE